MNLSLRKIAVIVGLIMLGVFMYQLYWLNGLYQTTAQQFEKNVQESMDIADQNELFQRLDKIKKKGLPKPAFSLGVNVEEDSIGRQVYYSQAEGKKDTLYKSRGDSAGFNRFKENIKTTEKLAAYIKKTLHKSADEMEKVNVSLYDSLLSVEFKKYKIDQPHQVSVVKVANDSVCDLSTPKIKFDTNHAKKFEFLYDLNGEHAYRLYIKNPSRQVLAQMGGIVATSVIVFVLLIYVFSYLLKTIRKLQTEEELKTNFTNNMTHELKTPIAVSYAAVDALLIADKPASAERQKKYLNIAKEQMGYLSGLVEQILSMSRRDNQLIELKPEPVNLEEIISGLIEKLWLVSDKPIELETRLNPSTLVADQLHLSNILNNLMENGIKYSDNPAHLIISTQKEGNTIAISVEDKGIGIDPKYQKRLFDKFYRVPTGNRHNAKGFGLGLFYVKEMTEKHGGTVEVKSELGKGSVFTIKIPQ